jgi:hypothetical protein
VTGAPSRSDPLAFKAKEIEELADVYFFRPLGMVFARVAMTLGLSPTSVTVIGTLIGIAGGVMLAWPRLALAGFGVIVLHSVLDSSDGQLARMTGRSSEFGRLLDGVSGYLTHAAIYGGIVAGVLPGGRPWPIVVAAIAAGVCNVVHAQMYDYHRNTFIGIAVKGEPPTDPDRRSDHAGLVGGYEAMERWLAGGHARVERAVLAQAPGGRVPDGVRARYRRCFYWPVRGWNLLGDNTRFYAVGLCAWAGHMAWFFAVVLVPMNLALVVLWVWQARADRRFLSAV